MLLPPPPKLIFRPSFVILYLPKYAALHMSFFNTTVFFSGVLLQNFHFFE